MGALGINDAALAVRFVRGFDSRFFLGRQRRRFLRDGLYDVTTGGKLEQLRGMSFPFQVTTRPRGGIAAIVALGARMTPVSGIQACSVTA